jgi:ribose 5-phosphate isomerase A
MSVAKKYAAIAAVTEAFDRYPNSRIIGIGSGSTIVFAVEKIKEIEHTMPHKFICIPSSSQAERLIIDAGMQLGSLLQYPEIDLTFDGADEIERKTLYLVKGGGAALTKEKIIASASKKFIVIADNSKWAEFIGEKVIKD